MNIQHRTSNVEYRRMVLVGWFSFFFLGELAKKNLFRIGENFLRTLRIDERIGRSAGIEARQFSSEAKLIRVRSQKNIARERLKLFERGLVVGNDVGIRRIVQQRSGVRDAGAAEK